MLETPHALIDPQDLEAWIRPFGGDIQTWNVLNDKGWSVVIHLGWSVLKVTAARVFVDGARMFEWVGQASPGRVPELIAWRTNSKGHTEMLFRPFGGLAIDSCRLSERPVALAALARSFGKIQADLKGFPRGDLPCVSANRIPVMFDEILEDAIPRCQKDHFERWSSEREQQFAPENLAATLRPWRRAIGEWADELDGGRWSDGADHVDLLPHNANLLPNGDCVVFDWEQATVGVPFFSLDVLLAYAQSLDEGASGLVLSPERATPTQRELREAFLREFPGPIDLALRLAPLRYCWAEWNQAEATGMTRYGVDDVVWWLCRSLRRWEAAT